MKTKMILICLLVVLAGCTTTGNYSKGVGSNWSGKSWNHPQKSRSDMQMDYYECQSRSAAVYDLYNSVRVEAFCMKSKGYTYY
jgi:hypothetical protein